MTDKDIANPPTIDELSNYVLKNESNNPIKGQITYPDRYENTDVFITLKTRLKNIV